MLHGIFPKSAYSNFVEILDFNNGLENFINTLNKILRTFKIIKHVRIFMRIFNNRHSVFILFCIKWHIIWCKIIINDGNFRFTQYFNLLINFEFCIIGYIWRNLNFNKNLHALHKSNIWNYILTSINFI